MVSGHILAIDDSPALLRLVSVTLESAGYVVGTSENPILLAAELRRRQPDLVLLDVLMPTLSGTQVLDALTNYGYAAETRIAFFSSLPEEELEQLATRYGVAGIRKASPFCEDTLLDGLRRLLRAPLLHARPRREGVDGLEG